MDVITRIVVAVEDGSICPIHGMPQMLYRRLPHRINYLFNHYASKIRSAKGQYFFLAYMNEVANDDYDASRQNARKAAAKANRLYPQWNARRVTA